MFITWDCIIHWHFSPIQARPPLILHRSRNQVESNTAKGKQSTAGKDEEVREQSVYQNKSANDKLKLLNSFQNQSEESPDEAHSALHCSDVRLWFE